MAFVPQWPPNQALIDKFFSNVHHEPNSGCWIWGAVVNEKGYGLFSVDRHLVKAHRFSIALNQGRWPSLSVLHSCDFPPCVNPAHLREGTPMENTRESIAKGRLLHRLHRIQDEVLHGSDSHQSKLTEESVALMRRDRLDGVEYKALANKYGVSTMTAWNAVNRKTWRHVK